MKNFSKFKNKAKKALFIASCYPFVAFADGGTTGGAENIAGIIANSANQQITESGKSVASILNNISIVFGILWIIVMCLTAFFNMEQLKQHSKLAVGALIIIGIVYGLSAAAMK